MHPAAADYPRARLDAVGHRRVRARPCLNQRLPDASGIDRCRVPRRREGVTHLRYRVRYPS
ncbi:hypothetical protein SAMN04489730_8515 [Amycolatopsis australiensis]|uniref:Uncharacterized protein n=1 Tax=Amycolatopsis australiensis TaxID=546364 RepID=A0A1K1T6Q3_9PSEU|nr:hypothetical protein SAMN04489730_8515 [Amycolatopsis australiensis]